MTNLYDLPKDILVKLVSEIEYDTQFREKMKFYKRLTSMQAINWEDIPTVISWMKEDSKTPSDFLKFMQFFNLTVYHHHMKVEDQNKYLLPNVKNTKVKSWEDIYREFDMKNYTYCEKCNSLYLGRNYDCCN